MMKKILATLSITAILAVSVIAAAPCEKADFVNQGEVYLKYIKYTMGYDAFNSGYPALLIGYTRGIKKSFAERIKADLGLTSMNLFLKDKNGQKYTINLEDAVVNVLRYYYSHLPKVLKDYPKEKQAEIAANALVIAEVLFYISDRKTKDLFIKTFDYFKSQNGITKNTLNTLPYKFLVGTGAAKNLRNMFNKRFIKNSLEHILILGLVEGYISIQKNKKLQEYIPDNIKDFVFYVISGNFEKADKILLKEDRENFYKVINYFCSP